MKSNVVLVLMVLAIMPVALQAQNPWNNKKCAVALTYDDALHVDLDHAIPALDSMGFKGTFYLSIYFPGCRDRIRDWKRAAAHGHELGNHTAFHPCLSTGRSWVGPENDLTKYSLQRIVDEIRLTNVFLQSLDGKTIRTFAYPCGDTRVGDTTYVESIKTDFASARGVNSDMYTIDQLQDLYKVGAFGINGQSAEYMIDLVKQAMEKNSLIVFLFHGVGGEHNLNVGLKEHSRLLHFLKENEKDIWVAPFLDITEYVKSKQGK